MTPLFFFITVFLSTFSLPSPTATDAAYIGHLRTFTGPAVSQCEAEGYAESKEQLALCQEIEALEASNTSALSLVGRQPIERQVYLPTRGITLEYVEQGRRAPQAETIILLPGYLDSWHSYERDLPLIPNRYHVYALSMRGQGDSSKPTCCYTQADFAADIDAFMAVMGIDQATVVGHSMGTLVARKVALMYPQRVARLALIGPSPLAVDGPTLTGLNEVVQSLTVLDEPFVREFQTGTVHALTPPLQQFLNVAVNESLKVPLHTCKKILADVLAAEPIGAVSTIEEPTLIVAGTHDNFFSLEETQELAASIPNSTLFLYGNTGHSPHAEQPLFFVLNLLLFVEQ